jgi:maltooligosyltrehalose trehalohydrolase
MTATEGRRLPCGVEVRSTGVHARVWAPACRRVELVIDGSNERHLLEREPDGHHSGVVEAAGIGTRYRWLLDGERLRADPCSRFQPDGPDGPSQVVDPTGFHWTDRAWQGPTGDANVLYELHVGTFTPAGTWQAAAEQLPHLARLGVTVIEMMPIADFPGHFGWGYDGVNLYAPTRLYGTPDDLRSFVDQAHAHGLAVILDVVYNHLGPDGNYLTEFSPDYFTDKYTNDWGRAVNFEGPAPAREFFVANAGYWVDEFHFDGLRLDATQNIEDASPEHVLRTITDRVRAAAGGRRTYVVGENEPQDVRLIRPPREGGFGLDGLWNDDFHHTCVVALVGRREAYYQDYRGSVQELVSCAKYGFLYQGQYYAWQKKGRGTPSLDLPPAALITYLENHDQVANSAFGERLHRAAAPARFRAVTAFLLLAPGTPLLFQGQEFNASAPFLYFADHKRELHAPITEGRRDFLAQFSSLQDRDVQSALASPVMAETFQRSKLNPAEREANAAALALHTDLIALRRGDPVIGAGATRIDGAVLAEEALVLRYVGGPAGDRLLIVNLGSDLDLTPAPEPLLAPPSAGAWALQWSSEAVRYGGQGTPALDPAGSWRLPGECALLFTTDRGPQA